MRKLFRFIIKYHLAFLFLIFETTALFLSINYNHYQKSAFLNSANRVSGYFFNKSSNIKDYFFLTEINAELSRENAFLRSQLPDSYHKATDFFNTVYDSLGTEQYIYRPAKVINNSVNKRINYITLNRGSLQGIKSEMGVISSKGVIGIVKEVSNNFSTVISLLNTRLKISSRIKGTDFFGSLEWDGDNYRTAILNEIPQHAIVKIGDIIETSGYSAIFPPGLLIGSVEEVHRDKGDSFYFIKVKLSVDFKKLSYVEIIENELKSEQANLEKITEDD